MTGDLRRRPESTAAVAVCPTLSSPVTTAPRCATTPSEGFLRVVDAQTAGLGRDRAGVTDLPARLRIERSAREEHLDVIALCNCIDRLSVLAQRDDRATGW